MSKADEEYVETERILKRVRPQEPSVEFKARVMHAAQGAWHEAAASIPWQIPIRRLAISAAAAVVLFSLVNLYCDHAFAHQSIVVPIAEYVEPCDLGVMIGADVSLIRYAVTATGPDRTDTTTSVDYLERVRRALSETERNETPDNLAPVERRSRLPRIPSSLNS